MTTHRLSAGSRWLSLCSVAAAACAAAFTIPVAQGFVEIAHGELLFEGRAFVMEDTNIFGNETEEDDVIWAVEPALSYRRRAGRLNIDGRAGITFNRFSDFTDENSNDGFGHIDITIPTSPASPLQGSYYIDYFNGRRVDLYLSDRIDTETFSTGLEAIYDTSARTSLRAAADYAADYPDQRAKNNSRSATLGLGYKVRPTTTVFLDYRYRLAKSEMDPVSGYAVDREDHALFIGVSGELSPALTGRFSIGAQTSDAGPSDPSGDDDQFVANIALEWKPRSWTTVYFRGQADSPVTNAGQTVQRQAIQVGINEKIGQLWAAEGTLGYDNFDFSSAPAHTENQLSIIGRLLYEPNKMFSGGFELAHYQRDPGLTASFDRTTATLFAIFKY